MYEKPTKEYLDLPVAIRLVYSFKEWMWLGDREKASLVTDMCLPEYAGDD